jgi:hypothetical protein
MLSVTTAEVQAQVTQNVKYDSTIRRLLENKTGSSIGNTHFAVGARLGVGFEINSGNADMVGDGRDGDPLPSEESTIAFNPALFFAFKFNDRFGLQAELNVMTNNGIIATYPDGKKVNAAYTSLDIPILLYYNIVVNPVIVRVFAGPYAAIPVGKINVSMPGLSGEAGIKNTGHMFGIAGGFDEGFKIGPGNIIGDFRYINDFNDNTIDFNGDELKGFLRRAINITVGYEFSL